MDDTKNALAELAECEKRYADISRHYSKEQLDSLAMKRYGRPRWTVGYYLHGTQHRKGRAE